MNPEKTPTKDTPGGSGRKALTVVGVLGAIAVNIAAFMLSADAINAVAEAAGISKGIAWAMVAAVDGLMVTGTVVFIANKLRGRSVAYPLTVLASGVLLSIICNALHAKAGGGHVVKLDGGAKMAVSAIPAVSLALSFHLIADMVKDSLGVAKTASSDASQERPSDASSERHPVTSPPSVSQASGKTLPEMPAKTPERTSAERPRTPRKTAPAKPKKTATTAAPDTRAKVRELLKASPDMTGADLARACGGTPGGYWRTLRNKVIAELIADGELPSVRAVGS